MQLKLIAQRLKELNDAIAIDRFTAHTINQEMKHKIQEAATLLQAFGTPNNDQFDRTIINSLLLKVCVYYAFVERNKEAALVNLINYQKYTETNFADYANACSLIAYVNTIDPTFRDPRPFIDALAKYDATSDNPKVQAYRAMNLQYLGLMYHRLAIQCDKANDAMGSNKNMQHALAHSEQAIQLEKVLLKNEPNSVIALAKSLHSKAVMLLRRYESELNKQDLDAAHQLLRKALEHEETFSIRTNAPHFLLATTSQSLAKTFGYLNDFDNAIYLLNKAFEIQQLVFNTNIHPDMAKTLHFKGDLHLQQQNHTAAVDAYIETLKMKKQLSYQDNAAIKVTEIALEKAIVELARKKPELAAEKQKEAKAILAAKDKIEVMLPANVLRFFQPPFPQTPAPANNLERRNSLGNH